MTLPAQMHLPKLNHEAFQKALDHAKRNAEGAQIRTRSEIKLEGAEEELAMLNQEGKEIRAELDKVEEYFAQLNGIKNLLETNEADNAVARRAVLAEITALRESGVEVPEPQEG